MALLWADGFGHWGNQAQMQSGGYALGGYFNLVKDASKARTGDYYVSIGGGGFYNHYTFPFTASKIITIGFAVYWDALTGRDSYLPMFRITGQSADVQTIFKNDGSLVLQRAGTVIATSAAAVYKPLTYNYFEIQCDAINKRIILRINNSEVLNVAYAFANDVAFSGLDWTDSTQYNADRGWQRLADLYITRGDVAGPNPGFLGDVRCRTLFPTGAGELQQWSVTGAADAVAALDNVPFDNAQFISTPNVGDVSNFQMTDLPNNTAYVAGLMLMPAVSKTDAGVCEVTPQVYSSDAIGETAKIVPGVNATYYPRIMETDPKTGLYWTKETVNALRVGLKRTA